MKKLLFLFSVIALAACGGSDDAETTPPDVPSPRLLTVVVNENPMQDENASAREMTRTAAETTTATLSSFTMNYTNEWHPVFTKTNGTWSTASWPVMDNTALDFYAHDGGDFQWNSGNPFVVFTMDNDAFKQKDFLVAKHLGITWNEALAEGKKWTGEDKVAVVSQTFDHACAAVQFNVYKEENTAYTVKRIVLKGMKNQANYSYSTGWGAAGYSADWEEDAEKRYYTLTNGDITVTTQKQLLPCGWLFFVPQAKDGIQIDVTYSKDGGTTSTTKTLTLSSGTWEAGKQYTVNIRIGKAAS